MGRYCGFFNILVIKYNCFYCCFNDINVFMVVSNRHKESKTQNPQSNSKRLVDDATFPFVGGFLKINQTRFVGTRGTLKLGSRKFVNDVN